MQRHATAHRWRGQLPNLLSGSRFVWAAAFPCVGPTGRLWAVILAGASDLADGFVARRYGTTSAAGGHIDAVADKVFVLTALITFLVEGRLAPWQLPCLLLRDVVVGAIALYAALTRRWDAFHVMPARWPGKITTAMMFLFLLSFVTEVPSAVRQTAVGLAIAASAVSATDYAFQFIRTRAADRRGDLASRA